MLRICNFGEHLKKIRGKVSQTEFADSLGLSQNSLSYLENGKREPSISLLFLLVEKKGIDIKYWFEEESSATETHGTSVDSNLKAIAQRAGAFDELKFSEIHSIISQLYVYLDTRPEPMLPAERRMLSDILAACQRLMDSDERPRPKSEKTVKVIND